MDTSRGNRTLNVDIWYPAENNGEEFSQYNPLIPTSMMEGQYVALDSPEVLGNGTNGYPLLIFSHGAGGTRQQSAKLMEHLSSWGFVVASPDHAGNSMNDDVGASIPFSLEDRPKDISFVIDNMLSPEYVDKFFLQYAVENGVGVVGHSYGGLTSLLVAPDAQEWSDDRVKAILPLSPAVEWGTDGGTSTNHNCTKNGHRWGE